jgi:four helix bundle protein
MRRSAVSIMSNIAEGYDRDTTREYLRFLSIAKASCAELRSQAYVVLDAGYIDRSKFDQFMQRITSVGQLTGALRSSIARKLSTVT